jgi:hypothetical protein
MTSEYMVQGDLEVQLTHPQSNLDTLRVAELIITDRRSRVRIASFELTLEDFHALLVNRSRLQMEGPTFHANAEMLAKVGLKRHVITFVPDQANLGPYEAVPAHLARWAELAKGSINSPSAYVSHGRGGWEVNFYVYSNDEVDKGMLGRVLTMTPGWSMK